MLGAQPPYGFAIVALARRLAVDLWRIALGRKKAQELGLRLTSPG